MGSGLLSVVKKWFSGALRLRSGQVLRPLGQAHGGQAQGRTRGEPPQFVDLNVTDQLALSFLLRFEPAPVDTIFAEVSTVRPLVSRTELLLSLNRMSDIGLMERVTPAGGPPGQRVYRILKLGKKLRGIIPVDPKSVLSVRI